MTDVARVLSKGTGSPRSRVALEVKNNPLARALVSAGDAQFFADTISRAGLGQRAFAGHLAESLADSLDIAGPALAQALARRD